MRINLFHFFVGVLLLSLTAIVIASFLLIGSPSTERARQLDAHRSQDLQQLASSIQNYFYGRSQVLPKTLNDLPKVDPSVSISDPLTKEPYRYSIVNSSTIELCATFQTDTRNHSSNAQPYSSPYYFAAVTTNIHPIGEMCFRQQMTYTPPLGVPVPKPSVY